MLQQHSDGPGFPTRPPLAIVLGGVLIFYVVRSQSNRFFFNFYTQFNDNILIRIIHLMTICSNPDIQGLFQILLIFLILNLTGIHPGCWRIHNGYGLKPGIPYLYGIHMNLVRNLRSHWPLMSVNLNDEDVTVP